MDELKKIKIIDLKIIKKKRDYYGYNCKKRQISKNK